jgi:hypothetical protein
MKKWQGYATLTVVLLLASYWCAAVLEGVSIPLSTEIWLGLASLVLGMAALAAGVSAITEWDWDKQ